MPRSSSMVGRSGQYCASRHPRAAAIIASTPRMLSARRKFVLRVDGDLDIVADGDLGYERPSRGCRDRSAILAAPLQFRQQHPVSPALLAQRLDLLREVFGARAVGRGFLGIALVEPLLLTALMRVPSTASSSRPKRLSCRHSNVNWRNTARKADRCRSGSRRWF
jgi:hypothetical protein